MATRTQFEPTWYETALRASVVRTLDGLLDADHIYYSGQSGVRQSQPYITLGVTSTGNIGRAETRVPVDALTPPLSDAYKYTTDQWKTGNVSVRAFGQEARALLENFLIAYPVPSEVRACHADGVSINDVVSGPNDISTIVDGNMRIAMQVDLRFNYRLRVVTGNKIAQAVHVDGRIGPEPTAPDAIEVEIDVDAP